MLRFLRNCTPDFSRDVFVHNGNIRIGCPDAMLKVCEFLYSWDLQFFPYNLRTLAPTFPEFYDYDQPPVDDDFDSHGGNAPNPSALVPAQQYTAEDYCEYFNFFQYYI